MERNVCILYESNGRIPSLLELSKGGPGRSRKVMVSSHRCRSPVVKEQSLAATLSVDHGSTTPRMGKGASHPIGQICNWGLFCSKHSSQRNEGNKGYQVLVKWG